MSWALRPRIERENAPDDLLSDLWLAELARLLPELCERYPDLPDPGGDKSVARTRLFEALARLGQALAARAPLVVFLDDVQWADAASLAAVLAYHALAAGLAEPAFRFSLAAGDEAMQLLAVRDAITFYEQARHLLTESVQSLSLEATLPAPEIEHLYTHLGWAYELNVEWEQARTAYTWLLAYAQDVSQQVMESTALNRLVALAEQ